MRKTARGWSRIINHYSGELWCRLTPQLSGPTSELRAPTEQLPRRQTVPARNIGNHNTLDHALGHDRQLFLPGPVAASFRTCANFGPPQGVGGIRRCRRGLRGFTTLNSKPKTIVIHGTGESETTRHTARWEHRTAYASRILLSGNVGCAVWLIARGRTPKCIWAATVFIGELPGPMDILVLSKTAAVHPVFEHGKASPANTSQILAD